MRDFMKIPEKLKQGQTYQLTGKPNKGWTGKILEGGNVIYSQSDESVENLEDRLVEWLEQRSS